jgi:hypothetical protein
MDKLVQIMGTKNANRGFETVFINPKYIVSIVYSSNGYYKVTLQGGYFITTDDEGVKRIGMSSNKYCMDCGHSNNIYCLQGHFSFEKMKINITKHSCNRWIERKRGNNNETN